MQPHSCAALTTFAYLHNDLVQANRNNRQLESRDFLYNTLYIRVQTPSYFTKIYHVKVERYSANDKILKIAIGNTFHCFVDIRSINYDADECTFEHSHDKAYAKESFKFYFGSDRFTADFIVPLPNNIEAKHDVDGTFKRDSSLVNYDIKDMERIRALSPYFNMEFYDTLTFEKDPVKRRNWRYQTWVDSMFVSS